MIRLSREDMKFKKASEYPGSHKLILAAIALETAEQNTVKLCHITNKV